MTKTKITQHFADNGIFRQMSRETLLKLFHPYSAFLSSREVTLPEVDSEEPIPYNPLAKALMRLDNDNPLEQELGEKLDDVVVLTEHYNRVRHELENLLGANRQIFTQAGWKLDVDADCAVALVFSSLFESEVSMILGRLSAIDTKTFKEFPWRDAESNTQDIEGENEDEEESEDFELESDELSSTLFERLDLARIKEKIGETEQAIMDFFSKEKYHSRCRIFMYPAEEEQSLWFVIEHGGRKQRIESLAPDTNDVEAMDYYPLTRNVVVMDGKYKVLRIKASASWQTNLYYNVFSSLLFGEDSRFVDSPVFTFAPIRAKGLAKTLERGEMGNVITRVTVKGIHMVEYSKGQKITIRLFSHSDLCEEWESKYHLHELEELKIALSIKQEKKTKSITVPIRLSEKKGLTVSKTQYTTLVREWLRRRGFEKGYVLPTLPECRRENALRAETDNIVFWNEVHRAWHLGRMTRNFLHGNFSPKVADFVGKHLVTENEPQYAKQWYDPNGKLWDVHESAGRYFYYDEEDESAATPQGQVAEAELEILKLNKVSMVEDIQATIFKGSKRVSQITDTQSGISKLGEYYFKRAVLYLYVSGDGRDKAFATVISHNKDDASIKGRLAFFSMDKTPPESHRDLVESGMIQCFFIGDILSYQDGELVMEDGALDVVKMAEYPEEKGIMQFWPQMPQHNTSFKDVRIYMYPRTCRINYGGIDKIFSYDELLMFRQTDPNKPDDNANRKLLRDLIEQDKDAREKNTGWLLDNKKSSAYNRLTVALCRFFGIQDCFYKPTPDTEGKKRKLYRLRFGECSVERD